MGIANCFLPLGVFDEGKYWDVTAEYAKNAPNDVLIKVTISNRGSEAATIHVLPTLWFRNTWIWGCTHEGCTMKARIGQDGEGRVRTRHDTLEEFVCDFEGSEEGKEAVLLFTENETNSEKLYGASQYTPYTKDAFHRYVINGEGEAVSPKKKGTKVAAHHVLEIQGGEERVLRVRLTIAKDASEKPFGEDFEKIFESRKNEADQFYSGVISDELTGEEKLVARQSYAGLLWTKQFYHYIIKDWLAGDPEQPAPPESRAHGRNSEPEWRHLFNRDIISMPDKWEYPWYASWDLAFHMVPMAKIDPEYAKSQLLLFLREWYMSPNGQLPAYEFALSDVNPPVHAWACLCVYKMSGPKGSRDDLFLARCFQKLLLNFTWWVNRKDPNGRNIFGGGFLGLDNIGVFDRSKPLPTGGYLEQADGTAWMAFYCTVMLSIALELAVWKDPSYEDMASKFFEHFVDISDAMNHKGLWDEEDGFYYDQLRFDERRECKLRVRSMVGLIPMYACLVINDEYVDKLPGFKKRMDWFLKHREDLRNEVSYMNVDGVSKYHHLLAIPSPEKLRSVLKYLLDEDEFLSPYGIRALSRYHKDHPFEVNVEGVIHRVEYVAAESNTFMFGGNSNWRGPIWLCVNFLLVECLERYDYFFGDQFKVECPTGSGNLKRLRDVSAEIRNRLTQIFLPDESGRRPCHGDDERYAVDENWKDLVLFYEFFDGDTGRGCGASHQTGWTSVVSRCFDKIAAAREQETDDS
ncbi:Glycosyl hydrolase family 63 C-terminal domain-containing [Paramuricea clavata]|uniref:Glycosyl hydrolase family 63 C-terminal domain-containing n=1 Tax=Paramuricea clavata TaxID=317549 RepID=A0A6S7HN69_PARCT|nr:Glycosyl hydrolase family 63 C-terminal domain-containing [Paramuricea clavata]